MRVHTFFIPEVDSTNSFLSRYQSREGEEMTVVWSDFQTAGRGCGSNSWESETGKNLTFSVLVRPQRVLARDQFILSMANALALKETLDRYVGGVSIKWPNDIYWNDRKICGTLIETTLQGSRIKDCIIGTGMNINQETFRSDAPNPVSLRQILGREVDREQVLRQVTESLSYYINKVEQAEWEDIRSSYRAVLYRRGEVRPYRFPDGKVERLLLVDVSDDGHLLLLHPVSKVLLAFAFKEIGFVI